MRLDRYLFRELFFPLVYCLAGFLIFWIAFNLLSNLDDYQKKHLTLRQVLLLYEARTPELVVEIAPIALLLALLYAVSQHARHHELIAIRAAGVSLARISLPYFGVGLIFSLLLLALGEWVVPRTDLLAASLETGGAVESNSPWRLDRLDFKNSKDGRIWGIGAYNTKTADMKEVQVYWADPEGGEHHLKASAAVRTNGQWAFIDAEESINFPSREIVVGVNPSLLQTNRLVVSEFTETPAQIQSEIKIAPLLRSGTIKPPQLSIREILNYLALHPELSRADDNLLRTQLHSRWAWPWTCLVVVLIALPFGAASGRRNVFAGVASGIFISFTFFVLLRLGNALGAGGHLPPWLAAWMPHLLFGGAGAWMTARVR